MSHLIRARGRVRARARARARVRARVRVRVKANLRWRVAEQKRVTAPAAVAERCGGAPLHAQERGAIAMELVLSGGGGLALARAGGGGLGRRRLDVEAADVHP